MAVAVNSSKPVAPDKGERKKTQSPKSESKSVAKNKN